MALEWSFMKGLEDKIEAIVIPSGNPELNLARMKTAIRFNEERRLNAPYIISGIGPDINYALAGNPENRELDFHPDLYDYMMKNTEGVIGMDVNSLDSEGNIRNTFPLGTTGKYAIVSYPLHLKRFKRILKKAKKEGKVSQDLELTYVPTGKTTPREIMYEVPRALLGPLRSAVKNLLRRK